MKTFKEYLQEENKPDYFWRNIGLGLVLSIGMLLFGYNTTFSEKAKIRNTFADYPAYTAYLNSYKGEQEQKRLINEIKDQIEKKGYKVRNINELSERQKLSALQTAISIRETEKISELSDFEDEYQKSLNNQKKAVEELNKKTQASQKKYNEVQSKTDNILKSRTLNKE
jgi:hypothetical protein